MAADARRCGILLGEVVLAIVAVSLLVRTSRDGSEAVEAAAGGSCSRIVSMSPSITETLFALGLGERVVGVTRYCNYPPEAKALPQIGGWLDPSYEAIVALRPDLIVTREGSDQSTATLRQLGLDTLVVHRVLDDVLRCAQAEEVVNDLCFLGPGLRVDLRLREVVQDRGECGAHPLLLGPLEISSGRGGQRRRDEGLVIRDSRWGSSLQGQCGEEQQYGRKRNGPSHLKPSLFNGG